MQMQTLLAMKPQAPLHTVSQPLIWLMNVFVAVKNYLQLHCFVSPAEMKNWEPAESPQPPVHTSCFRRSQV